MRNTALLTLLLASCAARDEGITFAVSARVDAVPPELREGYLTLSSVELFPCPTSAWLQRLNPVGTAWAHETSKPTFLGTPHVISLTSTTPVQLGTFTPPPGRWCRLRVRFAPGDADAIGGDGGNAPTVLLRTDAGVTTDDSVDALETAFPAVVLSADQPSASKTVLIKPSLWKPSATSPLASEAARTSSVE